MTGNDGRKNMEIGQLWQAYRDGRGAAEREKLVLHYLKLVKYVAGRMAPGLPESVSLDDLVSPGMLGLMKAVDSFDPTKAVKFETYAIQRIRGAMLDELRSMDWFPRSLRRKARLLKMATKDLESCLGRTAHDVELARHLKLDLEDFYHLRGEVASSNLISIEEEVRLGEDGTYSSVREILSDEKAPEADTMLEEKEIREILGELLDTLAEKERRVLALYYYEELTLAEIGEVLGVSESRVCQIHGKAVQRLKTRIRNRTSDNPLPGKSARRPRQGKRDAEPVSLGIPEARGGPPVGGG